MIVSESLLNALKNVATPSLSAFKSPVIRLAVMTLLEPIGTGGAKAVAPNLNSASKAFPLRVDVAVDGSGPEYILTNPEFRD